MRGGAPRRAKRGGSQWEASFLRLPYENGISEETASVRFVLTREAARQIRWNTLTTDGFERLLRVEGEVRFHRALR